MSDDRRDSGDEKRKRMPPPVPGKRRRPPPAPGRARRGPPPPPPRRSELEEIVLPHELELSADADTMFTSLHGFLSREFDHTDPKGARSRAVLLYELGNVEELVLGDPARALERFEQAYAADATYIPVLRTLRRRFVDEKRWKEVVELLEAEVRVTSNEERRAALLTDLAETYWLRLGERETAAERLQRALSLAPRSRFALELMRQLHSREDQWESLVDVLRQLVSITTDEAERARLTVEMAEITETRLGQAAEAEELYAHALELSPTNEKAAVALRRLYLTHQRWAQLNELLTVEAGREHEPDEMFADMYRAARIAEVHLADDDRAASLFETAAALRQIDLLPLYSLSDVYRRAGKYEELAGVLRRQLRLQQEPGARAELYFRLGRLLDSWLQRPDDAAESYRKALEEAPNHEATLRALCALYERLGRHRELYQLELHRAERHHDDELRVAGYARAATICETHLGDSRQAVLLYERAWKLRPGMPEVFRSLDRIYRDDGQWEALADIYEQRSRLTSDIPQAASLLRMVASICEERLSAPERAIVALEALRAILPEDREAVMQLARLYELSGRNDQLKDMLARWAELTDDAVERIETWRKIGDLCDGPLRRSDEAINVYRQILEDAPKDQATRLRLKAVLERLGRWDELVVTMAGEIEVCTLQHEKAALQLAVGRLFEDKLGDLDRAEQAYAAALSEDATFTPGVLALQELLHRRQRWEPLAELLVAQAERMQDVRGHGSAALLCRAAEIHEERLSNASTAEQLYNKAVGLDGSCTAARQGLERLYLAADDHDALEAHYLRDAEGAQNPVLRVRAYLRLATLFESAKSDEVGAAAAYESALKVIDDQPDALHALTSLCRRSSKHERLVTLLGRVAATAEDRDAAVVALKEWATLVHLHFSDRWDPEPIYRRVLDGDPQDIHAIGALDALAHRKKDRQALLNLAIRQARDSEDSSVAASLCLRAAIVLVSADKLPEAADSLRRGLRGEPTYLPAVRLLRRIDEQTERWDEAAEMLLREGELSHSPEARHQAFVRAGNVLLDRFNDSGAARGAFDRVFEEDPQNGAAFGRLAEILSAERRWSELVSYYDRRMAAVDAPARVPLQLQLAALYREHLGDAPAATEVLMHLLEADGDNIRALEMLSDLCIEQERWREGEQFLARLAAVADDKTGKGALLRRADVLERRLGEQGAALDVLSSVLDGYPDDRDALTRCVEIYRKRGDWERTVGLLERLASQGTASEQVNGLVDLAEIYSRSLGDGAGADKALDRAARSCVESGEGIERLTDYFERRGDFSGLADVWGRALDGLPPESSKGAVAVRLARARIYAGRLLRPTEAEGEILKALQLAPQSLEARLELAGLHLWGDNMADATAEYFKVLDQDPFSVEAFRGLYRVFDRRGDVDRSAGAAQAVCAVGRPDDAEAALAGQARAAISAGLVGASSMPLTREGYWQLLAHPDEPRAARELLVAVADHLSQVLPDEIEGLVGGAYIPLDPEDPLSERCGVLARALGIDKLQICIDQGDIDSAAARPGATPLLLVNERFAARAGAGEFRFAVGRALGHLLARTFYLRVLGPQRCATVLGAIGEIFDRGSGAFLTSGDPDVEDLARRATRAIPRRARRLLDEPARAYIAAGAPNFATWCDLTDRSAERAGLLLSGDIGASLDVLKRERASRKIHAELLRFSAGPHLYEARRRLGLAL